jgi:hypothetical protein
MPAPAAERAAPARSLTRLVPGVVFALAGAALGIVLHELLALLSALVVAVVIGIVAGNTGLVHPRLRPGLAFAGRHLLRAGVVVVGFRLSAGDLGDLGWPGAIAVMVTVSVTFVGMQWLGRPMRSGWWRCAAPWRSSCCRRSARCSTCRRRCSASGPARRCTMSAKWWRPRRYGVTRRWLLQSW